MKKKVATIATAAVMSSTFSTTVFASTYTVQPGDTLYKIASKHQTSVSELKTQNKLSSDAIYVNQTLKIAAIASTPQVATSTPAPTAKVSTTVKTYTVVSGDTLIKIANQNGISLAELKLWNRIEGSLIYPGQVLHVSKPSNTGTPQTVSAPPVDSTPTPIGNATPSKYVIKSGDTLSTIASQVGLSVEELKSYNHLTSDLIFAGQTLNLTAEIDSSSVSQPVSGGNQSNSIVQTGAPVVAPSIAAVINEAKKLVGTPYVWGGSTVAGFDCSGFIYYVFNKAGQSMNRTSAEGYYDRSFYVNTPQVGDLVFFENTYKAGISHVGVYLGNNEFIHAGSDGVQISSVSSGYWKQHFESYKRFY